MLQRLKAIWQTVLLIPFVVKHLGRAFIDAIYVIGVLSFIIFPILVIFYVVDFKILPVLLFGAIYLFCAAGSFTLGRPDLSELEQILEQIPKLGPRRRRKLINQSRRRIDEQPGEGNELAQPFVWFLFTTLSFYCSVFSWFRFDPLSLTGGDNSLADVGLFVVDLMLRGGLFDLMEHFDLHVGRLRLNQSSHAFSWFSFLYRIYIPVFCHRDGYLLLTHSGSH